MFLILRLTHSAHSSPFQSRILSSQTGARSVLISRLKQGILGAMRRIVPFHGAKADQPDIDLKGDRAIEIGWIVARAGTVPRRILDVGSGVGIMAGYLAGMGHSVTCVDPYQAPWHLPTKRIHYLNGDINAIELPGRFDLVTACSAVEHIGLSGRYGVAAEGNDDDLRAMQRIREMLAPSGCVLMTIPVGRDQVISPVHRIYGEERFPLLVSGYKVLEECYWCKVDGKHWEPCLRETAMSIPGTERYYALGLFALGTAIQQPSVSTIERISIVTSCNPYKGADAVNQDRALRSWIDAGAEIVVAGEEALESPHARDLRIVAPIERGDQIGTNAPMLRAVLAAGLERSGTEWLALCKADIVVRPDFRARVDTLARRYGESAMFAIRQRDLEGEVSDTLVGALTGLHGSILSPPSNTDMFIAHRNTWNMLLGTIPDFVFGRAAWDNWLHCYMVRNCIPVDASNSIAIYRWPDEHSNRLRETRPENSAWETPADIHNRALFYSSSVRIGDLGDLRVDEGWFIGA